MALSDKVITRPNVTIEATAVTVGCADLFAFFRIAEYTPWFQLIFSCLRNYSS